MVETILLKTSTYDSRLKSWANFFFIVLLKFMLSPEQLFLI